MSRRFKSARPPAELPYIRCKGGPLDGIDLNASYGGRMDEFRVTGHREGNYEFEDGLYVWRGNRAEEA